MYPAPRLGAVWQAVSASDSRDSKSIIAGHKGAVWTGAPSRNPPKLKSCTTNSVQTLTLS